MRQGSFVCEYAKVINPNIKVIGSAGSPEKVEILKKIGVDVAFNYKEQDVAKVLEEHGPIDMYVRFSEASVGRDVHVCCSYWDNVSGEALDAALVNMNNHSLIIVRDRAVQRRLELTG